MTPVVSPGLSETAAPVIVMTGTPTATSRPTLPLPLGADTSQALAYAVVNRYPHDPGAFTQGLVIHAGQLYESTGLHGSSSIRKVDLAAGHIEQIRNLPEEYFGEGITIVDDRLIQLTWKSGTGFVYDLQTFELLQTFGYEHEGWGITDDGNQLYVSDGTSTIHILSPQDYGQIGVLQVTDGGAPVTQINELEFIDGAIFANIWLTNLIAVIDPETGVVIAWIDLSELKAEVDALPGESDVLNGIAFNRHTGQIIVTGKLWPRMYEIQIVLRE